MDAKNQALLPGSDIDIMRDVYMTSAQRAAYDRIVALASAAHEGQEGVAQLRKVIKRIKFRLHFMGWPAEPMWNMGTDEAPCWTPDWRYEIDLIENALHGSPLTMLEKPTDTVPHNQLPSPHPPLASSDPGEAVPVAEIGPVYTLLWAGREPVSSIVNRHELKVGDNLYARQTIPPRTGGATCTCPSGDGSLRWPCLAHPPTAAAQTDATDEQIAEWVERHDLGGSLSGTDARCAFEDAQTWCAAQPEQVVDELMPVHPHVRGRTLLTLLWQKYDSGGTSMGRSYESVVLETAMELFDGFRDQDDVRRCSGGNLLNETRTYLSQRRAQREGLTAALRARTPG